MKGEDINAYIVKIEVPQTIKAFTDGLPTGLYQKILELDRPRSYEQWKQAAINRQQDYIHMKARLKAHRGGATTSCPRGWIPQRIVPNPNAMDTSAGRTQGRITGSEEINPATMPRGGYVPRGGFMQRGRGGRTRDLREVECYTCCKKGHLSCNCPQHKWNNNNNWTPHATQGRDAVVDDQSEVEGDNDQTATPNSDYPISIYANPHFYQNEQQHGQH